jgi:oligoendopeptidase F
VSTLAEAQAKLAELDRQETELLAGLEKAQAQEAEQADKFGMALVEGDTKAANEFQRTVMAFRVAAESLLTRLSALRKVRPEVEEQVRQAERHYAEHQARQLADSLTPEWLRLQESLNTAAAAWGKIRAGEDAAAQIAAPYADFPRFWQVLPGTTVTEALHGLDRTIVELGRDLDRLMHQEG